MISDYDIKVANRVTWAIAIIGLTLVVSMPFAVAWLVVAMNLV